MREHPILFSTLMVQAILAGRKTQTRRIINPQPDLSDDIFYFESGVSFTKEGLINAWTYSIGDILYIRESVYAFGKWVRNGLTKKGKQKWKFVDNTHHFTKSYYYVADGNPPFKIDAGHGTTEGWYKRPSLFMPKIASRIRLKITNIRVEMASEISETDAIAEGVQKNCLYNADVSKCQLNNQFGNACKDKCSSDGEWFNYADDEKCEGDPTGSAADSFESLWTKINGAETWNNWVWVYDFEIMPKD